MTQGGKHLVAAKWNRHLLETKASIWENDELTEEEKHRKLRSHAIKLLDTLAFDGRGPRFEDTPECRLAYRKFLLSSSSGLSQGWKDLFIDDYSLFAPITTQEDEDMAAYMSRADVREALHVTEAPTTTWPYSTVGFDYTKEYDACNWRDDIEPGTWSMIDFYKDIVPRLQITWIYNGDTDPCVSYEGTRTAVKRIGLDELDGGSYRPWFYNLTKASLELLAEKAPLFGPALLARDMGAQFGGEVVNYEQGLAFLTVHGSGAFSIRTGYSALFKHSTVAHSLSFTVDFNTSGHMVPQFRPQAALHMIAKMVHYQDLSPLLPTNETLTKMDDDVFAATMNAWTETARSPPYVMDMATWVLEESKTSVIASDSHGADDQEQTSSVGISVSVE